MNAHIINRQVIDLKVPSQKNAFGIQQRVRDIYFTEIIPLFDRVMSEMTPAGEVIYLDQLEIDLGVIDFSALDKELVEGLRQKITTQLKEKAVQLTTAPRQLAHGEKNNAVVKKQAETKLELIQTFFLTGNLPWWADDEETPPDINTLVIEALQQQPAHLFAVMARAAATPSGAQRIIFQLPETIRNRTLAALPAQLVTRIRELARELDRFNSGTIAFTELRFEAASIILLAALTLSGNSVHAEYSAEEILTAVIKNAAHLESMHPVNVERKIYRAALFFLAKDPANRKTSMPALQYLIRWENANPGTAVQVSGHQHLSIAALVNSGKRNLRKAETLHALEHFLDTIQQSESVLPVRQKKIIPSQTPVGNEPSLSLGSDVTSGGLRLPGNTENRFPTETVAEEWRNNQTSEYDTAGWETPVHALTRYAGLVLIAPFLPAFFQELQLVQEGIFTGEKEKHKAIHLLNFAATGKSSAPEYTLALHKILCGMEIKEPVPKTVRLTKTEKETTLLFLADIAEQWTTLQSSSGEAFRMAFMKRNGIIETRDDAFLLRIERGPIDMLLDTLPWNISIIKMPWMQQLLHVEW